MWESEVVEIGVNRCSWVNTARPRRRGLSNPTVHTRKGKASVSSTGSTGIPRCNAKGRESTKASVLEVRMPAVSQKLLPRDREETRRRKKVVCIKTYPASTRRISNECAWLAREMKRVMSERNAYATQRPCARCCAGCSRTNLYSGTLGIADVRFCAPKGGDTSVSVVEDDVVDTVECTAPVEVFVRDERSAESVVSNTTC